MIEGLLQDMNFMKASKINYDPHHIISHRREHNKNKAFDHQEIEGLVERANLMEYQSSVESSERLQLNPSHLMKSSSMLVPTPSKVEITNKRSFLEEIEIEDEDQDPTKIPKLDLAE